MLDNGSKRYMETRLGAMQGDWEFSEKWSIKLRFDLHDRQAKSFKLDVVTEFAVRHACLLSPKNAIHDWTRLFMPFFLHSKQSTVCQRHVSRFTDVTARQVSARDAKVSNSTRRF